MSDSNERGHSPLRQKLQEIVQNVADLYVVGLFAILCSLPMLTYVPAMSAFSRWISAEKSGDSVPYRRFFTFFKQDLKRGLPLNALLLLLTGAVAAGAYCLLRLNHMLSIVAFAGLCVPILALLALAAALFLFLPPMLAETPASIDAVCRVSLACFAARPFPAFLLMLLRLLLLLVGVLCPVALPLTLGLGCSTAASLAHRCIDTCFPQQGGSSINKNERS